MVNDPEALFFVLAIEQYHLLKRYVSWAEVASHCNQLPWTVWKIRSTSNICFFSEVSECIGTNWFAGKGPLFGWDVREKTEGIIFDKVNFQQVDPEFSFEGCLGCQLRGSQQSGNIPLWGFIFRNLAKTTRQGTTQILFLAIHMPCEQCPFVFHGLFKWMGFGMLMFRFTEMEFLRRKPS